MVRLNREVERAPGTTVAERLSKYGVAAVATVATGLGANQASAALVTTPVNIPSFGNGTFVDILPFATGAAAVSVTFATASTSGANPLAPNSELMIRGVNANTGIMSPRNTALLAATSSAGYIYVHNVGAAFTLPTGGSGTFNLADPGFGYFTYIGFSYGAFPPGSTGVAYFSFTNTSTGLTHDAWATIFIDNTVAGQINPTITAVHVDTLPEPSSMALLCLGAVGVARFRRRRSNA